MTSVLPVALVHVYVDVYSVESLVSTSIPSTLAKHRCFQRSPKVGHTVLLRFCYFRMIMSNCHVIVVLKILYSQSQHLLEKTQWCSEFSSLIVVHTEA